MHRRLPFLLFLAFTVFTGAEAAGKPARCPQMKEGLACPQYYDPVVCGKCEYGNLCEAKASGFRAEQCVKKGAKPKTAPAARTCPPPKADVVCSSEKKPVVCQGCGYANACLAGAAGFEAEDCKGCPDPNPEIVCTMQYAPVQCRGCRYSNSCAAGAAGFTKEQCAPAPGED